MKKLLLLSALVVLASGCASTAPSKPSAIMALPHALATVVSATTPALTLAWDYSATPIPDGYSIERAAAAGTPLAPSGSFAVVGSATPGTTKTYQDTTVLVGSAYCYQVRAVAGPITGPQSNVACALIPQSPTNLRLSLTFGGNGKGLVWSNPPGLNCTAPCSALFPAGTQVRLSEKAGPPWWTRFIGWSGACHGTEPTCLVTMKADTAVGVWFIGQQK